VTDTRAVFNSVEFFYLVSVTNRLLDIGVEYGTGGILSRCETLTVPLLLLDRIENYEHTWNDAGNTVFFWVLAIPLYCGSSKATIH
jgi:hypothetical protein